MADKWTLPKVTRPGKPSPIPPGHELIGHGVSAGYKASPERIEDIPDYDKLTRTEKWLMDKLPGIAESSVGKFLLKFSESWAGKALMVLDVGAEAVERGYGLAWQYDQAKDNPEQLKELKTNLGAAWKAGSLASDFTNAPIHRDGKWIIPEDELPGISGVIDARRRIMGGESLEDVRASMMDDLGVLALRAQKQDALQHIIADPLWIVGKYVKPLEFIQKTTITKLMSKALPGELAPMAENVTRMTGILNKVDDLSDLKKLAKTAEEGSELLADIEKLQSLAADIGKTAKKSEVLESLKQTAKHLESLVEMTPSEQKLLQFVGGIPDLSKSWDELSTWQKAVRRYSPFALTPAARAQDLAAKAYNWLSAYVLGKTTDPAEMTRILSRAVDGMVGPELGHMVVTVEGRMFTGMLKKVSGQADELLRAWEKAGEFERPLLEILEQVIGDSQGKIMQQLRDGEAIQIFERFVKNAGNVPEAEARLTGLLASQGIQTLSQEILEAIPKIIPEAVQSPAHFGAALIDTFADVLHQQALLHFGLKQEGVLTRLSDTMRAVESIAYLGLNPAYPIRNAVNNIATSIARGNFGIVSLKEVEKFWDNVLKFVPARAGEAYTPALLAQKTGETIEETIRVGRGLRRTSELVQDVIRAEKGWLTGVTNKIKTFGRDKMPFTKWAQNIEQGASQRAMYLGMTDFFKSVAVPGKGFSKIGKFSSALAEELGDDVVRQIERSLSGAWNETMIAERLFDSDNIRMSIGNVMKRAEEKFGGELDGIFRGDMIDQIEQIVLPAAKKGRGALDDAMGEVKNLMQRHVEDAVDNYVEVMLQEALGRLETEGPGALQSLWGELTDDVFATDVRHALDTERIVADIRAGTDPIATSARWEQYFGESEKFYSRFWGRQEKRFKAIAKASPFEEGKQMLPKFREIKKTWNKFFRTRKKLWTTLSEERIAGKAISKSPGMIRDELDDAYRAAISLEDNITREIDDLIISMNPDEAAREFMRAGRTNIADLRKADREFTLEFRNTIRDMPQSEIEEAYQAYWQQRKLNSANIWQEENALKAASEGSTQAQDYLKQTAEARRLADEQLFGKLPDDKTYSSFYTHSGKHLDPRGRVGDYIEKYLAKKDPAVLKEFIQDEPLAGRVVDWVINNKEAKEKLVKYIKSNPEEAFEIQRYTDYVLSGKYGENMQVYSGKLTMYRTAKTDADVVNPWDSMTQNPGFARAWKLSEERGPILEYEVPTRNVFLSHETHPAARASVGEEEIMLNQRGIQGSKLISVDGKAPTPEQLAKYSGIRTTEMADQTFLSDFHKIVPKETPLGVAMEELMYQRAFPALDAIRDSAAEIAREKPLRFADIPEHLQGKVRQYGKHLEGQMGDIRYGALKFGEWTRDAALLNYNRRVNLDTWLQWGVPYELWTTHTLFNWALHTLNRPHVTANILRTKKMLDTGFRPETGFPSRLKGHIRIKVPFMSKMIGDWIGNDVFINPLSLAVPIENFTRPLDEIESQERRDTGMAERVLEELLNDNKITHEDYIQAMQSHSGPTWDRAITLAQQDDTESRSNAFDLASMVLTPHAPIMWAYNASKGEEFQQGPFLPASRSMQSVAGLFGVDINDIPILGIGGKIRQAMGLHPYDKWAEVYRPNRMLVNMLATGEKVNGVPITIEDVKRAMIERQGPVFQEAKKRSLQQYGIEAMGSITGLPTKAYPPGEEAVREKRDEYEAAWKAYEDSGGNYKRTVGLWLENNPDYEVRLALFKEPEEQLRAFLVDQIWDTYNGLTGLHKREAREQMGDEFVRAVLNKETLSTDSIPVEMIAMWIKMMGSDPVGSLGDEAIPISFAPTEIAQAAQYFYDYRKQNYPNYYELQNEYFKLKKGSARRNYLAQRPELDSYFTWRYDYLKQNPTIATYLSDKPPQYASYQELQQAQAEEALQFMTPEDWQAQLGPLVFDVVARVAQGQAPSWVEEESIQLAANRLGIDRNRLIQLVGISLQNILQ